MCRVIAVSNQKGGVGKTVSCVNLGIGLAQSGKKVLLIDADPQGSMTISLGYPEPDDMEYSLASMMMNIVNDEPLNMDKTILHHKEGVDLIPANIELSAIEVSLVNVMSRELILRTLVEQFRKFYDFIIIDCMPSLGMMTINALACADSVLIPVQAAYLPVKGLAVSEGEETIADMDDGKHFTKSNVNVCYAAPRNKRKSRDWYETQLTVAKEITRLEGYPEKNVPFYIVTDDGYWFKAHTTSDGNKQFSAVGDELIMGRWLKGRLAAAGLVNPVNDTQADTDREGMITKEMLEEYGCENLYLKKTGQTAMDEDGTPLDVWMLSFKPTNEEGDED